MEATCPLFEWVWRGLEGFEGLRVEGLIEKS